MTTKHSRNPMKLLLPIIFSMFAFGQTVVNAPAVTIDAAGATAVLKWMGSQAASKPTELVGSISDTATTLTLKQPQGIGANAVLNIGTEHLQVTAKNGAVYTVTRGANGTTATAHAAGDEVTEMRYKTLNAAARGFIVDRIVDIYERSETDTGTAAAVIAAKAKAKQGVQ